MTTLYRPISRKGRTAALEGAITDSRDRSEFVLLTNLALNESDAGRFIDYLMKRDLYVDSLLKTTPEVFGNMTGECLLREALILDRLERERKETIEKMDDLSKNRKTLRRYISHFPFPLATHFFKRTV